MANILVVDDEPEIATLVKRILEAEGHKVTTACDGEMALAAVRASLPDVVLLDLNLPKMNGFEVCKLLKSDDATRAIPVIMLTAAYPGVEDAARGLNAGADEYVVKPFLREVLIHNVTRLLNARIV